MDVHEIIRRCDHTLLRQNASAAEIKTLCDEAMRYGAAGVCIPPCHVRGARRYTEERLTICTVIGFPNGYSTTDVKCYEARDAINNGADELDAVINLSMVKDHRWDGISGELSALREITRGKLLKVIIETCLLDESEKGRLCQIVSDSGADYIKTSTGFSRGGATADDIVLLRSLCSPALKIKAAGGIITLYDAEDFIRMGADRLGTSRVIRLALESGLV